MSDRIALQALIGRELLSRGWDAAIAALAAAQYGVVSHAQLLALGMTPKAIRVRRERGRLHELYRGVYAVGHTRVPREGRWLAAILACEPAVLRRRSAAALWEIRPYEGRTELTVPPGRRNRTGLTLCRSSLPADETTTHRGIPVTTVARTLLDLDSRNIDRAIREAEFRGLFDLRELQTLLDRYPRRPNSTRLRAAIAAIRDSELRTRSELEDRFRALLLGADLPRPRHNATLDLGTMTIEADCVWRGHKLVVELDGYAAHGTRDAYERDRVRDRAPAIAGWRVIRITWRQLVEDPAAVIRDLRRLLGQ